ncbi:MAG: PAS domain-containing sensor histidine kinase, partial [Deltaproteobacteria bacterium HGW-Deltaproteobacteria-7]
GVASTVYADQDVARNVFETIMNGGSWSGEVEDITKDGRRITVLLRADAIKDEKGKILGLLALNTDITERKKAEEEIRRLNESLEQRVRERTTELEAFSYSVSHDLRAPLRTIDGFSQALLEDYENMLDVQGKDYLKRIRASTKLMAELIEDLLKLSRITRSEMDIVPVNLTRMALSVMDKLQKSQPQRLVNIKIADSLQDLGDPRLIRIVLENLFGNAWKFTEKKKIAEIEFGLTIIDKKKVYFIRDNGAGFDMEYADKLFAPFQRLHHVEEYPGTGIGLATVKRIIHRHGGTVWAKGKPGQGATFCFTLQE